MLPFLAAWFAWRRRPPAGTLLGVAAAFAAVALALNLYPFDGGSSTVTVAMQNSATAVLATLGSIVALWLVTGIVDAGGVWRSDRTRMDFLRFSGEWLVYYVLIAIVGGALSGLTIAVFGSIQVDVVPFIGEWVLPCGAAGAVLVSAWLVGAKQRVIENIAPVLTKVFTPLFTLMMLALIVASVMQWNLVDGSRELLIAFDLVLVVVVALLVYSISARDPALPPGWFDRLQVLMLAAALVVDVIVLVAMIARTGEFGFSANKTASLRLNVILLANLAWARGCRSASCAGACPSTASSAGRPVTCRSTSAGRRSSCSPSRRCSASRDRPRPTLSGFRHPFARDIRSLCMTASGCRDTARWRRARAAREDGSTERNGVISWQQPSSNDAGRRHPSCTSPRRNRANRCSGSTTSPRTEGDRRVACSAHNHVADLAIVGGGYTGLWTAVLAKQRNPDARVMLVEAKSIGWAASGRNGGFCEASLTHGRENGLARWPEELDTLDRLGLENLDAIEAAGAELGMSFEFERNGALDVAVEPHQLEWLEESLADAAARGDDSLRWLDEAAVQAEVASPTYLGAVWNTRTSALLHPAKLAFELARVAEELGVEIFERSPVRRLETPGSTGAASLVTDVGRIDAARVVLATNVFPSLLKRNRLMTVPVYDYVLMTEPLTAEQLASIGWSRRQGIGDMANQFHYYRMTLDNRILFGGYDAVYHYGRRVRDRYEQRPAAFELLANHFFTTFPQLAGAALLAQVGRRHRHVDPVHRILRNCARRPCRVRGGLHGPRRRVDAVRRRGHARPARAARQRAHLARDGAQASAAVPARAGRGDRHQRDAVVARPGRPQPGQAQPALEDARCARIGVRLMIDTGLDRSGDAVRLIAGAVTDASALVLEHEPVPADQVVEGSPATGYVALDASDAGEIGVWEMTPGAMRDVEVDEVFVVLSGAATVEFEHPHASPIVLAPGSVVRLEAGMKTIWTVRQTLRKVYVSP